MEAINFYITLDKKVITYFIQLWFIGWGFNVDE